MDLEERRFGIMTFEEINEEVEKWFNAITTTANISSVDEVEDGEEELMSIQVAVPGLEAKDIDISVKNNILRISIPDTNFTDKKIIEQDFGFMLKPDMIMAYKENGILTVSILQDLGEEFKVEVEN